VSEARAATLKQERATECWVYKTLCRFWSIS